MIKSEQNKISGVDKMLIATMIPYIRRDESEFPHSANASGSDGRISMILLAGNSA